MEVPLFKEIPQVARQKETWNEWRERCKYQPVVFDGVSFDNLDLSDYRFMFCTLRSCSFKGATLHETNFRDSLLEGCDFTDAKFWKTMLEEVDFRTCRFNDFPVNCYIEGAIISEKQQALLRANFRKLKCPT